MLLLVLLVLLLLLLLHAAEGGGTPGTRENPVSKETSKRGPQL